MWMSKMASMRDEKKHIEIGTVTISGERVSVFTDGEARSVTVAQPGGYIWRPKVGDEVLVIKCEDGERVVSGLLPHTPEQELQNGEVLIMSDKCALHLKNDGSAVLTGDIQVTGKLTVDGSLTVAGAAYKPCTC